MNWNGLRRSIWAGGLALAFTAGPAFAQCQTTQPYQAWLAGFKQEAQARGISPRALSSALDGVSPNPQVIKLDRSQRRTFGQSFEQFSAKRITSGRLSKGRSMLKQHASTLARIEKQFGVPAELVIAIWGLETDYGAVRGKLSVIRSLVTLAHDCRRGDFFRNELMAAMQIVQHGDLSPDQMRGGWAGELGQTQFLPSSYVRFAVDFDGNGRADLLRSPADVLASTANYLRGYGWRPGQPYGPGTGNFQVIKAWNKSDVYARTIAAFAEKL